MDAASRSVVRGARRARRARERARTRANGRSASVRARDRPTMSHTRRGRARAVIERAVRWAREDFPEIVWPRPMDDPPRYVEERRARRMHKLTMDEHREVWTKAFGMWRESWANVFRRQNARTASEDAETRETIEEAPSTSGEEREERTLDKEGELLAGEAKRAMRAGRAGFKPLVTYLYETRGRAYRDGVREFIQAYREGFKEVQADYESGKHEETLSGKAASMIAQAEDVLQRAEKTEVPVDDSEETTKK